MTDDGPIFTVPRDMVDALTVRAKEVGFIRGSDADWATLYRRIHSSPEISKDDREQFTLHLRLLSDHYLILRKCELDRPKYRQELKQIIDGRKTALKHAKELRKRLELSYVASALPDRGVLLSELNSSIEALIAAIEKDAIHEKQKKRELRHSHHGLVKTFESIWELYTGGLANAKAFDIAKLFFAYTGLRPDGKEYSGEHADIRSLFTKARKVTEHLGNLTTVRRMSTQEVRDLKRILFETNPR